MRQASGTEPICPLPLLGLHQNNSGQVIYRQYMKYGSYLIGGGVGGFYAVCEIHVTAEWVRDRDDCLWDGAGMRRHHRGDMCMLPVLVSWSSMDTTALYVCTCAHTEGKAYVRMVKCKVRPSFF